MTALQALVRGLYAKLNGRPRCPVAGPGLRPGRPQTPSDRECSRQGIRVGFSAGCPEVFAFDLRPGGALHTFLRGPDGGSRDKPGYYLETAPKARIASFNLPGCVAPK